MIMCEDYAGASFNNLAELKKHNATLAKELVELNGDGEWENYGLNYYESLADYAYYELTEGWYAEKFSDIDCNGAPIPLDFIDLEALGKKLASTWDESMAICIDDQVITTDYGWRD